MSIKDYILSKLVDLPKNIKISIEETPNKIKIQIKWFGDDVLIIILFLNFQLSENQIIGNSIKLTTNNTIIEENIKRKIKTKLNQIDAEIKLAVINNNLNFFKKYIVSTLQELIDYIKEQINNQ